MGDTLGTPVALSTSTPSLYKTIVPELTSGS